MKNDKKNESIFHGDYKIINLKYEYPGYTGEEMYGIITDLSMQELEQRYAEQLISYCPYIVLPPSFEKIRKEYIRNDDKHRKRDIRHRNLFPFDDKTELHHPELIKEDFAVSIVEKDRLVTAINSLSDIQRENILDRYFVGLSISEIAKKRNISFQAVSDSINKALRNLKKMLKGA